MNTILTDDELKAECRVGFGIDPVLDGNLIAYARAVEAAVLAKLAQRNSRPVVEVIHARVEKMTPDQLAAYQSARERFKLAQQEPIGFMSEQQVPRIQDNEDESGCYLPMRKTPAGNFTLALYTHPAPPQADRQRVPEELRDRIAEAHDASLDDDHTGCRSILNECLRMLAGAAVAPAQANDWTPLTPEEQDRLDGLLKHARWLAESMPTMEGLQHSWALNARQVMARMHDWLNRYLPPATPCVPKKPCAVGEREAFEAWCVGNEGEHIEIKLERDEVGYTNSVIAACWEAWEARAAISSTEPCPKPEWQPIGTAPKDGTVVDLWHEELGRNPGCFWGKPIHSCGEMGRFCDSDWHSLEDGWVDAFNEYLPESEFTHWMPLPAAPGAAPEAPAQARQAAEPVRDEREPGYLDDLEFRYIEACEERDHLRAALASTERQPLTDEQIVNMANPTQHLPDAPEGWVRFGFSRRHLVGFARSIERAHGIQEKP